MDEPSGEKPKLHIDEDWKSQAQAEKERLERAKAAREAPAAAGPSQQAASQAASEAAPAAAAAGHDHAAEHEHAAEHHRQLPPPTFEVLITTLATQAMVLLGQIPNPMTGKAEIDLAQAQHFIDSLAMLEEKTAGNRTPQESRLLDTLLHELRMVYVHVSASQKAE